MKTDSPLYTEAQKIKFMQAALNQGQKAVEICGDNPPVGCVIVHEGKIVSHGHTQPPGQMHAEAMALKNMPHGLTDFDVFVTLEPCSFFGRTPSCARSLTKYPVRKVFVAMLDPHPLNQGAGIVVLRMANIPVEIGLLEEQARADLLPFLAKEKTVFSKVG